MDDCGDGSDEESCINHFKCVTSREYIPLSSVKDGTFDCADFSDECDSEIEIIIGDGLLVSALVIGALAVLFNVASLVANIKDFSKISSPIKLTSTILIMSISFGDLLMGVYLITIATISKVKAGEYCAAQFSWLISPSCAALGVISTVGSQISLFSMTCLSVYRLICVKKTTASPSLQPRHFIRLGLMLFVVTVSSLTISLLPLIPSLEDFFVNGLYYGRIPLFIGAPSKQVTITIV